MTLLGNGTISHLQMDGISLSFLKSNKNILLKIEQGDTTANTQGYRKRIPNTKKKKITSQGVTLPTPRMEQVFDGDDTICLMRVLSKLKYVVCKKG